MRFAHGIEIDENILIILKCSRIQLLTGYAEWKYYSNCKIMLGVFVLRHFTSIYNMYIPYIFRDRTKCGAKKKRKKTIVSNLSCRICFECPKLR